MKLRNLFTIVLIIIITFETAGIIAKTNQLSERSNDNNCIQAARSIGETLDAKTVVVLKRKNRIMAGILMEDGEAEQINNTAKDILIKNFGKRAKIAVESKSDAAKKIAELGCFVDTEMEKKTVEARFEHLWAEVSEGFATYDPTVEHEGFPVLLKKIL